MASKGKSKLAFTETAKLRKSTTIYENALDNAYYIEAIMKNGTRHLARILDCRLLKSNNNNIVRLCFLLNFPKRPRPK